MALARLLKSGSITVAAANATVQELLSRGKLNPNQLAQSIISARLSTALAPNAGAHAKP